MSDCFSQVASHSRFPCLPFHLRPCIRIGGLLATLLEPLAKENEALPFVWEGHPEGLDGEDDKGLAN
jgi:hypothetical protein